MTEQREKGVEIRGGTRDGREVFGIFLIPMLYVVFQPLREKIKGAEKKETAPEPA